MSEVLRVRVDAAHEGGRLRPHAVHLRRGVREDEAYLARGLLYCIDHVCSILVRRS